MEVFVLLGRFIPLPPELLFDIARSGFACVVALLMASAIWSIWLKLDGQHVPDYVPLPMSKSDDRDEAAALPPSKDKPDDRDDVAALSPSKDKPDDRDEVAALSPSRGRPKTTEEAAPSSLRERLPPRRPTLNADALSMKLKQLWNVGMLLVGFGIYMGAFVWWSGLNDRKDATCAVLGVVLLFSGAAIMSQVEVVKKALVEVGVMKSDGDRAKTD